MPRQGSLSGRRSWAGTPWPGSEVKIWEGLPWGWGRGQKLLDSGYYGYASYRDCPHGGVHTLAQLTQGSSGWVTCPPGPPKVGVGGHGSCMCTLAGDMTFVPEPGTGIGVSELPFTPHPRPRRVQLDWTTRVPLGLIPCLLPVYQRCPWCPGGHFCLCLDQPRAPLSTSTSISSACLSLSLCFGGLWALLTIWLGWG